MHCMLEVAVHWSCALMVNISMQYSGKKNLQGGTWFLPLQALSLVYFFLFFKRSVGFSWCFCCCLLYSSVPKHLSPSDTCVVPHPTLRSLQAACRVVQKLSWDLPAVQRWGSILVACMTTDWQQFFFPSFAQSIRRSTGRSMAHARRGLQASSPRWAEVLRGGN